MDNKYSGDTRVNLTALGLLALAECDLRMPTKGVSNKKQIEGKQRASKALAHAIRVIEREIIAAEAQFEA